jgi:hypothetical protein
LRGKGRRDWGWLAVGGVLSGEWGENANEMTIYAVEQWCTHSLASCSFSLVSFVSLGRVFYYILGLL